MNKINIFMPERYDLVVGDTFQLFYRGIIDAPSLVPYDILAVCDKGRNCPGYFEFTPTEEGQHKLKISVFGPGKELLGEAETLLDVTIPEQPSKPINILCMGSSTTAGGEWACEAYRRLTATDGEPKGDGLKDIKFIGTCNKGPISEVGYEGYGGWRWETWFPTKVGSVWVRSESNNKQPQDDQHSYWKDENGNIWQLETLAQNWLKFNRYLQHEGPKPEKGTKLTHYKNANNTEDIFIDGCGQEERSPYYDEELKEINFKTYCERNGYDGIDLVYIMLGGNGGAEAYQAGLSTEELCASNVKKGKHFVELLHKYYPNARVSVMGLVAPSATGGMGKSYGASLPYCDYYGYHRYVMLLNKAYEDWSNEPEYRDFMDFVPTSSQMDAVNNMPMAEKPVNTRSKVTEMVGTNGLHPMNEGYLQIGDAAYRNMVHVIKKIK